MWASGSDESPEAAPPRAWSDVEELERRYFDLLATARRWENDLGEWLSYQPVADQVPQRSFGGHRSPTAAPEPSNQPPRQRPSRDVAVQCSETLATQTAPVQHPTAIAVHTQTSPPPLQPAASAKGPAAAAPLPTAPLLQKESLVVGERRSRPSSRLSLRSISEEAEFQRLLAERNARRQASFASAQSALASSIQQSFVTHFPLHLDDVSSRAQPDSLHAVDTAGESGFTWTSRTTSFDAQPNSHDSPSARSVGRDSTRGTPTVSPAPSSASRHSNHFGELEHPERGDVRTRPAILDVSSSTHRRSVDSALEPTAVSSLNQMQRHFARHLGAFATYDQPLGSLPLRVEESATTAREQELEFQGSSLEAIRSSSMSTPSTSGAAEPKVSQMEGDATTNASKADPQRAQLTSESCDVGHMSRSDADPHSSPTLKTPPPVAATSPSSSSQHTTPADTNQTAPQTVASDPPASTATTEHLEAQLWQIRAEQALASGQWRTAKDSRGRTYYVNSAERYSCWNLPKELQKRAGLSSTAPPSA